MNERPADIEIFRKTHATVTIQCNQIIASELYHYFSAYATNYKFAPLYRSKQWDGKIRFFKLSTNELPIGLVEKVYGFAKQGKYTIKCNYERFNNIDRVEFQKFVDSLEIPKHTGYQLRDYQFEAAYQAVCKKNLNMHISTRGGKTLVMYIITRFLHYMKKKTLIVVPSQQLVEQAFGDFMDYGWQSERYCHRIYSGQRKIYDSPVTIACWQSMISTKIKTDNPYEGYDCIIIDEAHGAKGQSLQELAKICINADYRFGFSGTYPEATIADWYSIVGSLGAIQTFATYQSLQKAGHIAQSKIYNIILEYSKEFKLAVYDECGNDYPMQCDKIYNNPVRNAFITKMVQNMTQNCLCLFTKKEKHGIPVYEYFKEHLKDKIVLYIDGDIPLTDRQDIVKIMESNNNVVVVASYGCMSTGVTVKNLPNIVFLSGYKSKTKVFQSLGRSLGLHEDKEFARLFDVVDDVSFKIRRKDEPDLKFINHSLKHYKEREVFYQGEGWEAKVVRYKI